MTYNATADIRLVLAFAETGLVVLIVIVIIIILSFQYIAYMSSGPKHELWSQKEGGESATSATSRSFLLGLPFIQSFGQSAVRRPDDIIKYLIQGFTHIHRVSPVINQCVYQ